MTESNKKRDDQYNEDIAAIDRDFYDRVNAIRHMYPGDELAYNRQSRIDDLKSKREDKRSAAYKRAVKRWERRNKQETEHVTHEPVEGRKPKYIDLNGDSVY